MVNKRKNEEDEWFCQMFCLIFPWQGYYLAPTILTNVSDQSSCMQDEIFGPVTCVVPFDNEEEVIERANDVKYGLCAVVWTKDLARTHRLAQRLQVGTVWVNCWLVRDLNMPFGGSKASGVGREGCKESLDFFTESRTVCIKLDWLLAWLIDWIMDSWIFVLIDLLIDWIRMMRLFSVFLYTKTFLLRSIA